MTTLDERAEAMLQEVEPDASHLVPVSIANLLTTPTPAPPFVVDGLIPRRVVTLLGGHGGAGKSNIGLTLCAYVAGGEHTWAGHRVEDGRALYVSLEDSGEVVRHRLRNIVEACGLDVAKVERRLTVVDGTAGDTALAYEANEMGTRLLRLTAAHEELVRLAEGVRLIVVDNASDAYDAGENDRRMVRGFVRSLARIARDNDAGLILLAHIDKAAARFGSAGNSYSGSTAWHNSARSRLALVRDDAGAVELVPEKLNFGRLADPIPLAWNERGVLMPVSRSAGAGAMDDAEHVMAAMRAAQAAGVDVGAARSGPATTQTVLATFEELPTRLKGVKGRSAFWTAIGKLQATGRIKRATVTTVHRKPKAVMLLADCASSIDAEVVRANSPHPYALYSAHGDAEVCGGLRQSMPPELARTGADAYRAARDGQ